MGSPTDLGESREVCRAVVLAAGEGSRLGEERPKQLCQVAGLTLLERTMRSLQIAGVEEVGVVVGYQSEQIQEYLGSDYVGMTIQYIHAEDWSKGNLYSFLAAQGFSDNDFILCMCDHIFDPQIVQKLMTVHFEGTLVLAVDRIQQSSDDTLVLEQNGQIRKIGKSISEWNCIDTGIFRCSPRLFKYAKRTVEKGGIEFAECVELAAKAGKAQILDVSDHYWIDVDTPEDARRAKQVLAEHTQKGRGASDFVAHYLNRPIENWLVFHLADTRITPNLVTIVSNILAYLTAGLFLFGFLLPAALLTFVVGVVDGVDGKLARIRHQTSRLGKLEHAFDLLFEFTWLLALALYLSLFWGTLPILLAAISITLMAFYRMVYDLFSRTMKVSLDNYGSFERKFRRIAGRRNLYNIHFLIAILLGLPLVCLFTIMIHAAFTGAIYTLRAGKHLRLADRQNHLLISR